MNKSHSKKLFYAIIIAVVLGGVAGFAMGEGALMFSWMGNLFINALKMILVPLIVSAIISGMASFGDIRQMGRPGAITFGFFIFMMITASIVSIIVTIMINPGEGISLSGYSVDAIPENRANISDILLGLISPNIAGSAANMELLQLVVFSVIFGAALTTIGEKGKVIVSFFEGLNKTIMVMVGWIMYFSPFGIFALVAIPIANAGGGTAIIESFNAVGGYVFAVCLGLILQGIVLFMVMKAITGRGITYIRDILPAVLTAWGTSSSSATMPTALEYAENAELKKSACRFVIPLGSTIHMNGSAVYQAAAAIFLAGAYGITLGIDDYLTIMLLSVLAAFGSAGIPQGGYLMTLMIMSVIGIPVEGFGLILAVDWFLDRAHTTLNVYGDLIAVSVIDRFVSE